MSFSKQIAHSLESINKFCPIINAWKVKDSLFLTNHFQRDFLTKKNRDLFFYFKQEGDRLNPTTPFPFEYENIKFLLPSPSGQYLAVVKSVSESAGSGSGGSSNIRPNIENIIEIYKGGILYKSINTKEYHSNIYTDPLFHYMYWFKDETKILYTAETKIPSYVSHMDTILKPDSTKSQPNDKDAIIVGGQYEYKCDKGEQLNDIISPSPYIYDIHMNTINRVQDFPSDVTLQHICVTPDEKGVIFTGLDRENNLGLIFCKNRFNKLYQFNFEAKISEILYDKIDTIYHLWFSPNGKYLVFGGLPDSVEHDTSVNLYIMDWDSKSTRILIDRNMEIKSTNGFPGLYFGRIVRQPFSNDSNSIYLNSYFRSHTAIIKVDITTNNINVITQDYDLMEVLEGNKLLSIYSTPSIPPRLCILDEGGKLVSIHIPQYEDDAQNILENIKSEVVPVQPKDDESPLHQFDYIYTSPRNLPRCIIIYPHGGPNSTSLYWYTLQQTLFTSLGFGLVFPNYRGSTGYPLPAFLSLKGNIGKQDISDVMTCISAIKDRFPDTPLAIMGGSHGGFITGHLIGQYPDLFNSAVLINPVLDLPLMCGTTDIPDWCYGQTLGVYNRHKTPIPSAEYYKKLHESSPINYIENVKTPSLFLVGKADRRVPYYGSIEFFNFIKSKGVDSKLFLYPKDNHSLGSFETLLDELFQSILWISQHANINIE